MEHTYINTHTRTYTYTYARTHTDTHTYTCTHPRTHTDTRTHILSYTHTRAFVYKCVDLNEVLGHCMAVPGGSVRHHTDVRTQHPLSCLFLEA